MHEATEDHIKSAENIAIADLAADGKALKKAALPAIPIAVVVTLIVCIALGAVVGPVAAILASTSAQTTSDLSTQVMSQAVQIVSVQVQDVLNQPKRLLSVVNIDTNIKRAMLYNWSNLKNETQAYKSLGALVNTSPWISGVGCNTYPNLWGNATPFPWGPSSTYLGMYRSSKSNDTAGWSDLSTGGIYYTADWNETTQDYSPVLSPYPFPFNLDVVAQAPFYTTMLNNPTLKTPYFNIAYSQGTMIASASQSVFDDKISTKHPIYACSFGFETESALGNFFRTIYVTPNTHLFMIDVTNGFMRASSVPDSLYWTNNSDPYFAVTQYTPLTSPDTYANQIGAALISQYGNFSLVPNTGTTETFQASVNGQTWIINTKYLEDPNYWLLIVAMPRSDFFADVDNANKKVLIIAVIVSAAGITLVAIGSFFSLRPLKKLAVAMGLLTKMDFSALEGNILEDRSGISEVRDLQITFATMCKAFAVGIRKNKELMSNSRIGGKTST